MYAANSRTSAIRFVAVGVVALLLAGCGGGAKTVENPLTTTGVQPADLQRAGTVHGRRAGVQAQRLGQPQGDEPLRPVPRERRPGAAVRAPGRHQPRVRGRERDRQPRRRRVTRGWCRRWPAATTAGSRAPPPCGDILTTWITSWAGAAAGGGTQGHRSHGADHQGPGREQGLPDLAGAVLDHRAPGAEGILRALPHVVGRCRAVALLRIE